MDIVTGAFGYIGRYIAAQLIAAGRQVRTITTHVDKPNPFGAKVEAYPYNFDDPNTLIESLRGADTLYNTYWIRFEYGGQTFDQAVNNTEILFECAVKAGIKQIVHISVTKASVESHLPYYVGKGRQEEALKNLGIDYRIVRPTLVFGVEDILVNNIAWLIRKFPLFPIMGDGRYQLQPVFVGDLASITIDSINNQGLTTIDAIGPESYSYLEFVKTIAKALGKKPLLIKAPPKFGIFLGRAIGLFVRDVILTEEELMGLMSSLLTSIQEPNGDTRFSKWIEENRLVIGRSYSSELDRHFRWSHVSAGDDKYV